MIERFLSLANSQNLPAECRSQVERVAAQTSVDIEESRRRNSQQTKEIDVKPQCRVFSLEKDWHVLHYALNGTTTGGEGALANAVLGGQEIPDVDRVMDYGPLRYLEPEQVRSVADALTAVDPAQLLSRLDQKDAAAKQIYLYHTLGDLADWSYLPQLFEDFRGFYGSAAHEGSAMLLAIM